MNEQNIRGLIEEVREGKLARRDFMTKMVSLGLAAPFAGHLLLNAGIAQAQTPSTFKPTKRGGGGALRVLWWQGATLLNPHFATGTKDQDGCRIFYEPLASWDKDGNLIANLAAEIPTAANGGLSKDGKTVVWKLKRGVTWHDGKPFTSADVVFNWEYASDPATAAVSIGSYKDMKVEAIDSHTIKITFDKITPFWAIPFVGGAQGSIIPKHLFEAYKGAKSREAPNNLKPVGTGPFKFVDFTPGDMVRGTINTAYHQANKPFFDSIEMKGGGDSVSAARAVLQTGEYDFAWNLQVEDEILLKLEAGGKGKVVVIPSGDIEFIQCNFTDPNIEIDGERSSIKTKHPVLTDPAVRQALALLVDRASVQKFIYGRAGIATADFINNPDTYTKLYSDLQMYTTTMNAPDAEIFMNQYVSWEFATKANKWQGRNSTRWSNPDYDALYKAAQGELDPVKRASMYIKMNDMVVQDHAVIPVVSRPRARGANLKLRFSESGWDSDFWALQDWHRVA